MMTSHARRLRSVKCLCNSQLLSVITFHREFHRVLIAVNPQVLSTTVLQVTTDLRELRALHLDLA